jgi:hypothetical protein
VLEIKKIQAQTFGLILHQAHSKAPLLEVQVIVETQSIQDFGNAGY